MSDRPGVIVFLMSILVIMSLNVLFYINVIVLNDYLVSIFLLFQCSIISLFMTLFFCVFCWRFGCDLLSDYMFDVFWLIPALCPFNEIDDLFIMLFSHFIVLLLLCS